VVSIAARFQRGGEQLVQTASRMDRRWWMATTAVLLAAVVIAVLALEVRTLRSQVTDCRRARALPFVGQWVPTTLAPTIRGDTVTLGETAPGRSQVLFFFTTTCPYCLETLPTWQRIAAQLRADPEGRHDAYWVSLSDRDSTEQYVASHGVDEAVAFLPDRKTAYVFRVVGVPMTVVLDHRGRITYVRGGVLAQSWAADSVLAAARRATRAGGADIPVTQYGDSATKR